MLPSSQPQACIVLGRLQPPSLPTKVHHSQLLLWPRQDQATMKKHGIKFPSHARNTMPEAIYRLLYLQYTLPYIYRLFSQICVLITKSSVLTDYIYIVCKRVNLGSYQVYSSMLKQQRQTSVTGDYPCLGSILCMFCQQSNSPRYSLILLFNQQVVHL